MHKNYNYLRQRLMIPEYGRHIQEMVDSLLEIEDRDERTRQAKAVIAVMGNLNPHLRDTADIAHKLWDHLFIMSDFRLDVDSPYALPKREDLEVKPEPLNYPQSYISHKHYGKNIVRMLRRVAAEGGGEATAEIGNIARYMRAKSYEYNLDHPNNEVIIKDIKILSGNSIEIDEEALNNIRSDYKQNHSAHQQRNKGRQQQAKGKNRAQQQQKNHKKAATRHTNTHNGTR
jgi:hypothetical protein